MSKRAVILCGGFGTRLRPYTIALPKPLMPIGEYPIVEIIIRQLVENGFEHITMAVNHQAEIIKAFFNDGSKWNIKIDYSVEDKPLGTMGPLKLIPDLPANFLVMNGDILTDLNYSDFYNSHVNRGNIFTVGATTRVQETEYGVLESDAENNLIGFKEKPTFNFDVSMGIYMLSEDALKFIPENQSYGFDSLMLELIKQEQSVKIEKYNGYWLDIGRPDDYEKAIEKFSTQEKIFLGRN